MSGNGPLSTSQTLAPDLFLKNDDALSVGIDKITVCLNLFLKILAQLLPRQLGAGVARLFVVAGDHQRNLGVEHGHVVAELIQR